MSLKRVLADVASMAQVHTVKQQENKLRLQCTGGVEVTIRYYPEFRSKGGRVVHPPRYVVLSRTTEAGWHWEKQYGDYIKVKHREYAGAISCRKVTQKVLDAAIEIARR